MKKITVIDYKVGNLLSIQRAVEKIGWSVEVVSKPEQIKNADKLILPGVGAFGEGIRFLSELNLVEPLQEYAKSGKSFLGICLGMQLLMSTSNEFGEHKGLGIVEGKVTQIPLENDLKQKHKIPHIGWSPLLTNKDWSSTIFKGIKPHSTTYFVHSYAVECKDENLLAYTEYDRLPVTASIQKDNVFGVQFHPEKSGAVGLRILENFSKI